MRGYSRWTRRNGSLEADWVGSRFTVRSNPTGVVVLTLPEPCCELTADEARMVAVRLIEGAALADADAIREAP